MGVTRVGRVHFYRLPALTELFPTISLIIIDRIVLPTRKQQMQKVLTKQGVIVAMKKQEGNNP